jgi:hypothetical protein
MTLQKQCKRLISSHLLSTLNKKKTNGKLKILANIIDSGGAVGP